MAVENYEAAFCDVQIILTLSLDYKVFEGRVTASQLRMSVRAHVENYITADCWLQLYDRWSSVDDIGSLSVIYQMLKSDAAKGILYFQTVFVPPEVELPRSSHAKFIACPSTCI